MIFLNQVESVLEASSPPAPGTGDNFHYELEALYNSAAICDRMTGRFSGSVLQFMGFEEIVRSFMELRSLTVCSIYCTIYRVYADGSEVATGYPVLEILYHRGKVLAPVYRTADDFLAGSFLYPYKQVCVNGSSSFNLHYYAASAGTITVDRTFADGTTDTLTYSSTTGLSYVVINRGTSSGGAAGVHAHVEFGYRKMDIYFLKAEVREQFIFRNVFNVQEYVTIPASLSSEPKTEFEEAQQDSVLQRYDIEQQLSMELKSASIPSVLYNQLLAMCRAKSVMYDTNESMPTTVATARPVIIEEYKLPKSTAPNTSLTVDLKFKYCDTEMNDVVLIQ